SGEIQTFRRNTHLPEKYTPSGEIHTFRRNTDLPEKYRPSAEIPTFRRNTHLKETIYHRKKVKNALKRNDKKQNKSGTIDKIIDDVAKGKIGLKEKNSDDLSLPSASSGNIPGESDVVRTSRIRTRNPNLTNHKSPEVVIDEGVEGDLTEGNNPVQIHNKKR